MAVGNVVVHYVNQHLRRSRKVKEAHCTFLSTFTHLILFDSSSWWKYLGKAIRDGACTRGQELRRTKARCGTAAGKPVWWSECGGLPWRWRAWGYFLSARHSYPDEGSLLSLLHALHHLQIVRTVPLSTISIINSVPSLTLSRRYLCGRLSIIFSKSILTLL